MSLEMLDRGLEERIPRLYRHDAESFVWVLTYATVVNVEYKNHSVKISRPTSVQHWFTADKESHISSKQAFSYSYGHRFPVAKPHKQYSTIVRGLIDYWVRFERDLVESKSDGPTESEIDNPEGALESFIKGVETTLRADAQKEFAKVKALLLEAIRAPEDV